MTQYVSIELKTSDPDFRTWIKMYKPTGNGIPMLFIVSAEGKEIYNRSGAPRGDGLNALLRQGIEATGGIKSLEGESKEDKKLASDLRKAKLMMGRGSMGAALKILANYAKNTSTGDAQRNSQGLLTSASSPAEEKKEDGPKSKAAEAMEELVAEITSDGQAEVKKALGFVSEGKMLVAAVGIARAERIYGEWPPLATEIKQARLRLSGQATSRTVLKQAELIDGARAFEEKKMNRQAIVAYEKVLEEFPESEAATLSKKRIIQLMPARTWTDKTGKHRIQAFLVALNETKVKLRKQDGSEVVLSREDLSDTDREFLTKIR